MKVEPCGWDRNRLRVVLTDAVNLPVTPEDLMEADAALAVNTEAAAAASAAASPVSASSSAAAGSAALTGGPEAPEAGCAAGASGGAREEGGDGEDYLAMVMLIDSLDGRWTGAPTSQAAPGEGQCGALEDGLDAAKQRSGVGPPGEILK